MEITVERKFKKPNYIIGNLYIAQSNSSTSPLGRMGGAFCNTLEPPEGTPLESVTAGSRKAIPPGTYNIKMHWSPKFGKMLPLIYTPGTNPPRVLGSLPLGGGMGRGAILIHAGNYPRDTVGCILVGMNTKVGMVQNSRDCLALLVNKIRVALSSGEAVIITIR